METRTSPRTRTQPLADLRWLALATTGGATLGAITAADAATVQINLVGNQIDSLANTLNADLTGDGNADLTFLNTLYSSNKVRVRVYDLFSNFSFTLGDQYARNGINFLARADGTAVDNNSGSVVQSARALLEIEFSDAAFNSGAATRGFVEAHVFNTNALFHTIEFTRFVFDNADTALPAGVVAGGSNALIGSVENGVFTAVPEPSRLALLTLGAAGILARRRRKTAAA